MASSVYFFPDYFFVDIFVEWWLIFFVFVQCTHTVINIKILLYFMCICGEFRVDFNRCNCFGIGQQQLQLQLPSILCLFNDLVIMMIKFNVVLKYSIKTAKLKAHYFFLSFSFFLGYCCCLLVSRLSSDERKRTNKNDLNELKLKQPTDD